MWPVTGTTLAGYRQGTATALARIVTAQSMFWPGDLAELHEVAGMHACASPGTPTSSSEKL
jgi:hypothetical protein